MLVNGTAIILCPNPVSYGATPVPRTSSLGMTSGVRVKRDNKSWVTWVVSIVRTRGLSTSPVIRPEHGNTTATCYPRTLGADTELVQKVRAKAIGMTMATSTCHTVLICQAWWTVENLAGMLIIRRMLIS